jgi:hypothetical protein
VKQAKSSGRKNTLPVPLQTNPPIQPPVAHCYVIRKELRVRMKKGGRKGREGRSGKKDERRSPARW